MFPKGTIKEAEDEVRAKIAYLAPDAIILGSKDMSDYQDILDPERKRASQWHAALIEGHDLHNVAITGRGTVDGNNVFNPDGEEEMQGPHATYFNKCDGISVENIFVKDESPVLICENIDRFELDGVREQMVSENKSSVKLINIKNSVRPASQQIP